MATTSILKRLAAIEPNSGSFASSIPLLVEAFGHEDPAVREAATKATGRDGWKELTPTEAAPLVLVLGRNLFHKDPVTRVEAAQCLAYCGPDTALPALADMVKVVRDTNSSRLGYQSANHALSQVLYNFEKLTHPKKLECCETLIEGGVTPEPKDKVLTVCRAHMAKEKLEGLEAVLREVIASGRSKTLTAAPKGSRRRAAAKL